MVPRIHPLELKAKLDAGDPVYLLDCREANEHAYCALPNSTHIPLGELPYRAGEVEPPDGAAVVVYCHHGVRSLSGAAILQQHGFPAAASLSGGIDAWSVLVDPRVPRY